MLESEVVMTCWAQSKHDYTVKYQNSDNSVNDNRKIDIPQWMMNAANQWLAVTLFNLTPNRLNARDLSLMNTII